MRVLILGLGPAASAAAITACEFGAEVHMVGRDSNPGQRPGETLPPEVRPLLCQLGIYDLVNNHHAVSPGIRSIWEDEQDYENDFIFNPYGNGWHLDRALFDRQLLETAAGKGAKIVAPAKLRRVRAAGDPREHWTVTANSNGAAIEFEGDLVVDATGRSAWFARRLGIARTAADKLIGIVGFLDHPICDDARTIIEANEGGWCYFANLPGERSVAAFMTDSDLAATYPGGPTALWHAKLLDTPNGRRVTQTSAVQLRVVSACSARLTKCMGERWVAIGDAAISWDPLSSKGIATALESGIRAVNAMLGPSTEHQLYSDWIEATWSDYVQNYNHFYSRVQRWSESQFWRRRSHSTSDDRQRSNLEHPNTNRFLQAMSNLGGMK